MVRDVSDWGDILEAPPPAKSIAIYVGRNLTADGSVLLGGFGHDRLGASQREPQ
jgi:hypothetical protein